MRRLLVTGASGLLGVNLALRAAERYHVVGITHHHRLKGVPFESDSVDLSAAGMAERVIERYRPDIVIHCAALANIDEAERDPQKAWRVNAEIPGELAQKAARSGIQMVHISTDAVFDGVQGNYTEEDTPNPLSTYGRSKLGGEQAVAGAFTQAVIARVNFFGWSLGGSRSLAEFFFNNLSAGKQVKGFTDVLFCPLFVDHLSDILLKMVEKKLSGLYHTVSREALSKFEFGKKIARQFSLDEHLITPVSVTEGGLAARRSPNLNLRVDKLEKALGRSLPGVDLGISGFHRQYLLRFPQRLRSFTDHGAINQAGGSAA